MTEPRTFEGVAQDNKWIEAIKQEISALENSNTYGLISLSMNKKPIGCKWVYKLKHHFDGTIDRYKVWLLAKGYTKKECMDYREIFYPVVKMVIV